MENDVLSEFDDDDINIEKIKKFIVDKGELIVIISLCIVILILLYLLKRNDSILSDCLNAYHEIKNVCICPLY